jgi:nucleosome binding factor SPN SPT16 subunit
MVINNKKVTDIQFYKESIMAADDIDMRGGRRRANDFEELEEEERERQAKRKLTQKFLKFAQAIQEQSSKTSSPIEVDIPVDEFSFYGCPIKSQVKVRPTKNCLIAISEFPPFVLELEDIEFVYFERMDLKVKNVDMAIIFKDFTTFKRINSVPRESVEDIKVYLNQIGVIFSEGVTPMNWTQYLNHIRSNFDEFLEEGAWKHLMSNISEADEDDEPSDKYDSEFDASDEESVESEEDDSSFDEDEDDYSSEVDDDEEEGLSWDEMDKRAMEEDRKAAVKRQMAAQQSGRRPPPPKKRK